MTFPTLATTAPGLRTARGRLVRAAGSLLIIGTLSLASALPASAHSSAANYRTAVTSVSPTVPGLRVTASTDGSWLKITNHGGSTVVVLGYEHEPYLKITKTGVWQNTLSPATYLNRELTIGAIPANVDPKAPPSWKRVSTKATARFHDHRIHWMGNGRPPVVDQDPGRAHLVKRWAIQLTADSTPVLVRGTLRWTPAPAYVSYIAFGALALTVIGLLIGYLMTVRRRVGTAVLPDRRGGSGSEPRPRQPTDA